MKRETRFTSKRPVNEIISKIEEAASPLGFDVKKNNFKVLNNHFLSLLTHYFLSVNSDGIIIINCLFILNSLLLLPYGNAERFPRYVDLDSTCICFCVHYCVKWMWYWVFSSISAPFMQALEKKLLFLWGLLPKIQVFMGIELRSTFKVQLGVSYLQAEKEIQRMKYTNSNFKK